MQAVSDGEANVGLASEIAARRWHLPEHNAALVRGDKALATAGASAPIGLCCLDSSFTFIEVNPWLARLHGRPIEAHVGHTVRDVVPEIADVLEPLIRQAIMTRLPVIEVEVARAAGDGRGQVRHWLVSYAPLAGYDGTIGFVSGVIQDVTARRARIRHLEWLALHDALTGLPNRVLLMDRLDRALKSLRRRSDVLAVVMVDLDGFKAINDRFGHAAGDEVLRQVAKCLADGVRDTDTVARLGGDEFVLLLQCADLAEAAALCRRLISRLAVPVCVEAPAYKALGTSLGVALFPNDGLSGEQLLAAADVALRLAKDTGKGRLCFHDSRTRL